MLVLTRKIGELIVIGDDIRIKVVEIKGRQVRIGIEAPKSVQVNREEIYKQKNELSEAPAKTGTYGD